LRLGPPLTTTTDHIDQGVEALRDALDAHAEVAVGPAVAQV
jgi:4-aminobutyrate aminotransferase-like enzyme